MGQPVTTSEQLLAEVVARLDRVVALLEQPVSASPADPPAPPPRPAPLPNPVDTDRPTRRTRTRSNRGTAGSSPTGDAA